MPRLLRKPKWSWADVRPVPPLLPALILGYVGWMLRGYQLEGQLKMPQGEDFTLLGIFTGAIIIGYVLARVGYLYMQKAGTPRLRRVWTGIMILGLLGLAGSLVIQIWRPEYGLPSMYAWTLWSVLLLVFEGRGYRPSMWIKRLVDKVEEMTGFELDDLPRGPFTEELDDDIVEEELDDEPDQLPVRQSAFQHEEVVSPPGLTPLESLFGSQRPAAPPREETPTERRFREHRSGSGVRH